MLYTEIIFFRGRFLLSDGTFHYFFYISRQTTSWNFVQRYTDKLGTPLVMHFWLNQSHRRGGLELSQRFILVLNLDILMCLRIKQSRRVIIQGASIKHMKKLLLRLI